MSDEGIECLRRYRIRYRIEGLEGQFIELWEGVSPEIAVRRFEAALIKKWTERIRCNEFRYVVESVRDLGPVDAA